ncbi:MAG TPA: chromate efflux transporter [Chthoniobacteraceae bacterium]|nr:chromate efflux transporter [Chthoniobacteraceae bacterium]
MPAKSPTIPRLFLTALRLGLTSFGGPVAHLGYFHEEFVTRRKWLDDLGLADLVALCQSLPGPASSQVMFGVGLALRGFWGGLACWLGFTLPSAALMIAAGYGAHALGDIAGAGWLAGLKIAAVAVVANAVWGMGAQLCPDRSRVTMALLAAFAMLWNPAGPMPPLVILAGGIFGWARYRRIRVPTTPAPLPFKLSHARGAATLLLFFLLLFLLPAAASWSHLRGLEYFNSFYRVGALVFGGGHVVLPLLQSQVAHRGWVNDSDFIAGYGLAQAMPGPLFSFAAFLGAASKQAPDGWQGGLICLLGIYLSPILLMAGAIPFWETLRRTRSAQAALRGANAAVTGILLAALYDPLWVTAIHSARDLAVALIAFMLLAIWRCPSWLIVLLAAGAGQVWLRG